MVVHPLLAHDHVVDIGYSYQPNTIGVGDNLFSTTICKLLTALHYEHTAFQTSNAIINMTPKILNTYLYVLEEIKYWQAGEKMLHQTTMTDCSTTNSHSLVHNTICLGKSPFPLTQQTVCV